MINKIIRNYLIKQTAGRSDDGIMITLRDPQKVELLENVMADLLMRYGIDPKAITSEAQLKGFLNQIEAMTKQSATTSGIKNTQSAKVFDLEGNKLDPNKPIMGGKQEGMFDNIFNKMQNEMKGLKTVDDDLPPVGSRGGPDDIAAPIQSAEESLKDMAEAEIKKKIEADNKSSIQKILDRKNREDVYGLEDYDTTNMSDIKKEIIRTETKLGNLNPDDPSFREKAKPLVDKKTELQKKLRDDKADGGRIGLFKGAQADTKKGKAMSPGTSTTGGVRDDNPFTGGGGGGNNNPPPNTPPVKSPIESPFTKSVPPPSGLMSNISPSILARLARMRKGLKPILGEDGKLGVEYLNEDELYDTLTNFRITQDLENLIKTKKLEPELKYRKEIGDNTLIEGGINQEGDASIMFKKQFADGGRIGLKDGMNRRTFLKFLAGAASIPIIGKIFKPLKVGKTVTKVPIIKTADVAGKPEWFDQLVNKVILEGDDVSKKLSTVEREVVHTKKINDADEVTVYQDLNTDSVRVEYNSADNMFGEQVDLSYKRTPPDEGSPKASTEFEVEESGIVGRQTGPDDYDLEVEGVGGRSISDIESDLTKLKTYATGEKPTLKELSDSMKRKQNVRRYEDTEGQMDYVVKRQGEYDTPDGYDDYASGGIARMLGE